MVPPMRGRHIQSPLVTRAAQPDTHATIPAPRSYREALPPDCPPPDAKPLSKQIVIRLVPENPASDENFDSHAKLGKKPGRSGCTACELSSCSVFIEPEHAEQITDLPKYPKIRGMRFKVRLLIDASSGIAIIEASGHVHLWMFKSFDPLKAIQNYDPLP